MSAVLRFLPFGTRSGDDPQTRINDVQRYRAQVRDNIDALTRTITRTPVSLITAVGDTRETERDYRGFDTILRPVVGHLHMSYGQARAAERRLPEEEAAYTGYSDELVALHKRLAESGSRYREFTQDAVNETLTRVPDTVGVIVDDRRLQLTFNNVKMVPSDNPYLNINGGKAVSIPMDTLVASVNLTTGEVLLGGTTKREGAFRMQAHPHAMPASNPCLGGFEGTFYDACQKADIEVIALVLRFFLSQANQHDSAGKYWPHWMPAKILNHHDNLRPPSAWYVGNIKLRAYNEYLIDNLGRSYIRGHKIMTCKADNGMGLRFKDLPELRKYLETTGVTQADIANAFTFIGDATMSKTTDYSRIW